MKRTLGVLTLLLLFSVPTIAADREKPIDFSPIPFGIMGPPYSHMKGGPDPLQDGEDLLQLLELSGARWTRNDFWWSVVEPERGQWDFDYFDQAIESYRRHRIHPLMILCYGSAWSGKAPDTEEEMQRFGEYVYRMVDRYQYWVKHWEIWNEPNILPFWNPKPNVQHYTRLLQIAYQRAKEADPDCTVLGGAMAGADLAFLRGMYENGAKGHFDVLSYHTYGNDPTEESQSKEIEGMRAIMREQGDDKPLWLTETGIYTGPAGVPEEIQAERIVKSEIRWVSMGVRKIIQLALKDWTDDPNTRDATSFRGFTHANGDPKPSFFAHRVLCDRLGDKRFLGRPPIHPDLQAYLFGNDLQNTLVLWTDLRMPVETILDLGVRSLLQTDLSGKETLLQSPDGRYTIEVSSAPIYLEGVQERILLASQIRTEAGGEALAIGDRGSIQVSIRNPFEYPLAIAFKFQDTPEMTFPDKEKKIRLEPGQEEVFQAPVQIAAKGQPGERLFKYTIENPPDRAIDLFGRIEVESPLGVEFQSYSKIELPKGEIGLRLTNRSNEKTKAQLSFTAPSGIPAPSPRNIVLKARKQTEAFMPLDLGSLESGREYRFQAELRSGDAHASAETTVRPLKAFRLNRPIKIDGVLDDWKDYPANIQSSMLKEEDFNPNLVAGAEDISARGWIAWDEEALYLALEVTDDYISLPNSAVVWDFDSLQIAIDGANDALPKETFDKNDFEFEIALLRDGGKMVYATQYPEGFIASVVEEHCEAAMVREDASNRMIYEVRIPGAILPGMTLKAGSVAGFSFIVNDNDGPAPGDREGWLELTPGIGYGKDPSLYYDLVLWP